MEARRAHVANPRVGNRAQAENAPNTTASGSPMNKSLTTTEASRLRAARLTLDASEKRSNASVTSVTTFTISELVLRSTNSAPPYP